MEEQFLKTIKKFNLINDGDSIVVGVSGGPDSICLLDLLNNLKIRMNIKLYVAHINHMIRDEAEADCEYVKDICNKLNIECFIEKSDVKKLAKTEKISIEESGRKIRYKFFEEVLKKTNSNKIATAHNANDNAETVLMNVIRGTGLSGLKGIDPIREGEIIRPIIECSRNEIEFYCAEKGLNPVIDKSNMENIYTRNKIRNLLIPYIQKEFNPNIINSLNRLSDIAKQENRFIDTLVIEAYNNIVIKDNLNENKEFKQIELDLKKFNNLDFVIKSRIILFSINKLLGTVKGIEKINIEDIIKMCGNNIGNKYLKPNKNIKIYIKNGKILFIVEKILNI